MHITIVCNVSILISLSPYQSKEYLQYYSSIKVKVVPSDGEVSLQSIEPNNIQLQAASMLLPSCFFKQDLKVLKVAKGVS